ncbi:hypothetical protein QE152_g26402 [Popillia japonica]|uniref:Retrovirus-related Pol polyprotein from transposon TNT 1-94-like beta-barrel domain-containing protein n=1 Tax=Popillia japonica TaxID=7064 RepID=A0AAW1JYJ6_POPJA
MKSTRENAHMTVEETGTVAFMMSDGEERNISWFLDSGATEHMVNNKYLFTALKNLKEPIKIAVAKQGQMLEAHSVGNIDIISEVNGKQMKIPVQNVLYVPDLLNNLLSIRKLEDKGMRITFCDKRVEQ